MISPVGVLVRAGVIVIGGSEGGLHQGDARLLAQAAIDRPAPADERGLAVLALTYFGASGVPAGLVDVPLDYFSRAVDLLAGSGDPRIGAVVSVVGSGIVTAGIDDAAGRLDRILHRQATAWTDAGAPVRPLAYRVDDDLAARIEAGDVVRLRAAYPPVPSVPDELEAVSIAVERIRGPVLLLSAVDDQMWDSAGLSQVAADRLARNDPSLPLRARGVPRQRRPPPGGTPGTGRWPSCSAT